MGEAKRRRLAGEPSRPWPEAGSVRMVDPEAVPDMPGHVRVTLLDDDDQGSTAYLDADRLAGLLEVVGRQRMGDRTAAEVAADTRGWARMRATALDTARQPGEAALGAVLLGLWCALHGPGGDETRRRVSTILGRAGRAAVLLRRHRATGCVATMVEETLGAEDLAFAAELARRGLPAGVTVVSVPSDDRPREH